MPPVLRRPWPRVRLSIVKDPDSFFEGLLRSGNVSLAGLHPFEMLVSLPPFAGWTAKACEHCFYGEVSKDVLDLEDYVANELSFIAPNGALSVHAPYSKVRRRLALFDASGASYCYRDLLFGLAKKVETAGEGHNADWDNCLYDIMALRQPYRSTESAPKSALDSLLRILGAVASTEARRQSQWTLGLAPLHRAAHTVSVAPAVTSDSELIVLDELHVAYLRATPPLCHLCGKEGLAGVLFFFCCNILALSTKICDFCDCLTPSLQFDKIGYRARGVLPRLRH